MLKSKPVKPIQPHLSYGHKLNSQKQNLCQKFLFSPYHYLLFIILFVSDQSLALEFLPIKDIKSSPFSVQLSELKKRFTVDEWSGINKRSQISLALNLKHQSSNNRSLEGDVLAELIICSKLDLTLYQSRAIAQKKIESIRPKINSLDRFYRSRLLIAESQLKAHQDDHEASTLMLKSAKNLYNDAHYSIEVLRINEKLVDSLITTSEFDSIETLLQESTSIIERNQLIDALATNHFLRGRLDYSLSNFDRATENFSKAITLYNKSKNFSSNIKTLLHISLILEKLENYKENLERLLEALQLAKMIPTESEWEAKILSKIATSYSKLNQHQLAKDWIFKSIKFNKANSRFSDLLRAKVHLISILNANNELKESTKIIQELNKSNNKYWTQELRFLFEMAIFEYYILQNDQSQSEAHLKSLVDVSNKSKSLEKLTSIYKLAVDTHKKTKKYQKVLDFQELYYKAKINQIKETNSFHLFYRQNRLLSKQNEIKRQNLAIKKQEAEDFQKIVSFIALGFLVVITLVLLYIYQSRKVREERVNLKIRLKTLIDQMKLHFLFNSLTTIRYYLDTSFEMACEAIEMSSSLYRNLLKAKDKLVWPLASELELVENYVGLQKLLLDEGFHYELKDSGVDRTALQFPCMLLHTIVENSIKHIIPQSKGGGGILIEVIEQNGGFLFTITDRGDGNKRKVVGTGTGLKNTKERLLKMYGQKSDFKTEFNANGSVVSFWVSGDTERINRELKVSEI